jgi:hypothetical protein
MCTHFLTFIAGKMNFDESADITIADMASSMWFVFDILIKSMAIKLDQEQQLGTSFDQGSRPPTPGSRVSPISNTERADRSAWWTAEFARLVTKVVQNLVKYYKSHITTDTYKPSMELNKVRIVSACTG